MLYHSVLTIAVVAIAGIGSVLWTDTPIEPLTKPEFILGGCWVSGTPYDCPSTFFCSDATCSGPDDVCQEEYQFVQNDCRVLYATPGMPGQAGSAGKIPMEFHCGTASICVPNCQFITSWMCMAQGPDYETDMTGSVRDPQSRSVTCDYSDQIARKTPLAIPLRVGAANGIGLLDLYTH